MSPFPSAGHLLSWAGLAPRLDESAGKRRSTRATGAVDTASTLSVISLDEAYLDVSENRRALPTARATAKEVRGRILAETGLTASAGISYNKFLAKLASDYRKPNGQFAITPEMGEAFVETLPVAKFHGVGPVTAAMRSQGRDSREAFALHRHGVEKCPACRVCGAEKTRHSPASSNCRQA